MGLTSPKRHAKGDIDPVVGRDQEIKRVIEILKSPYKKQPRFNR